MHDIGPHQNGHTKSILDKNTTVQRDKLNIARFITPRTLRVLSAQADAKPKFRQIDECLNVEKYEKRLNNLYAFSMDLKPFLFCLF